MLSLLFKPEPQICAINKDSKFQTCLTYFFLTFGLIWSLLLCAFFLFVDKVGAQLAAFNYIEILSAVTTCLCIIITVILIFWLADILKREKWAYPLALCGGFCFFMILCMSIPFSPTHDCYTLYNALCIAVSKNDPHVVTSIPYMGFYVQNKIVFLIYYFFAWITNDVVFSVKSLNVILLFSSCVFISQICGKLFSPKAKVISLFAAIAFTPFLLTVGPYIYPLSIFFASLAFNLYLSKKHIPHYLSFLVCGFLFVLRPTALIFILAYIAYNLLFNLFKKDAFRHIISLGLIAVCAFAVNSIIGSALFHSGLHPYPGLLNSSFTWTFDLGTRNSGTDTGTCTYTADQKVPGDIASEKFNQLWAYYGENSDAIHEPQVKQLNSELYQISMDRITNTLQNPRDYFNLLSTKFYNFHADVYKAYYYTTKISADNMAGELYQNYEKRFFLSQNTIFLVFYATGFLYFFFLFVRNLGKNRPNAGENNFIALFLSCVLVTLAFLFLTEVMKKYMYDFFVPMVISICAFLHRFEEFINNRFRKPVILLLMLAAGGFILNHVWNFHNIEPFKNSKFTLNSTYTGSYLTIDFGDFPADEELIFIMPGDSSEVRAKPNEPIEVHFGVGSSNVFRFRYKGKVYTINN